MPDDTLTLADVAHGRSGDKGNHANVAVLAYTAAGFAWLKGQLTADVVGRVLRAAGAVARGALRGAELARVKLRPL